MNIITFTIRNPIWRPFEHQPAIIFRYLINTVQSFILSQSTIERERGNGATPPAAFFDRTRTSSHSALRLPFPTGLKHYSTRMTVPTSEECSREGTGSSSTLGCCPGRRPPGIGLSLPSDCWEAASSLGPGNQPPSPHSPRSWKPWPASGASSDGASVRCRGGTFG